MVAACMPAYQSGQFIAKTLDSVLAQDYPNLRLLISVDVCEDDTLTICRRYQRDYPNITVFEQSQRQGWLNNTNFLFSQVEDPYFFYMQHDDLIHPGYVSSIMGRLAASPGAVLGYTDMTRQHYSGGTRVEQFGQMDPALDAAGRIRTFLRSPYWYVVFRGIVSREAYARIGPLQRRGSDEFGADFVWLMNLACRGPFMRVPQPLYDKFVLETSLAESWKKGLLKYLRMYRYACGSILDLPLSGPQRWGLLVSAWIAFGQKVLARALGSRRQAQ